MKIKKQTRKLAVGCSKHCFEVVDKTDEVSSKQCKRVITRYLSFMEDLLYTISKVKLLEDILMPQPIVPVEIPQSRRFDSKKRNDILLKIRIGKLEVSFFQSLNLEMIEQLLDKVLLYDNSSI